MTTGGERTAFGRLTHFLYLGTEGNLYVTNRRPQSAATDNPFNRDNVQCIEDLIADNQGLKVVEEIQKVHVNRLSYCPDAPLFALALCAKSAHAPTRIAAYQAFFVMCSTSFDLFTFIRFMEKVSAPKTGWGRALRRAVSGWYNNMEPAKLAEEVTRYISRKGWTHKDVLRLGHVKPLRPVTGVVLKYVLRGWAAIEGEQTSEDEEVRRIVMYLGAAHRVKHSTDEQEACHLIELHNLSLDHVPTSLHKSKEVWNSIVARMPLNQLLVKLPILRTAGLLRPNTALFKSVLERLKAACDQPPVLGPVETFQVLKKCMGGNGDTTTGSPRPPGLSQLESALATIHNNSFQMFSNGGRKVLVAVDVRPSMFHKKIVGQCLTSAEATAILLKCLVGGEANSSVTAMAFSTSCLSPLAINNKMALPDIIKKMQEIQMGPVNLSAPLRWAQDHRKAYELVMVCTDNQTQPSAAGVHPALALREYRETQALPQARYCVCALASNQFSLAPPNEPNMLDLCGFSPSILRLILDFIQANF